MKVFSSDKGFTIIETMVAIAILAVGTLGVASMLAMNFSSDKYASQTRRAESLGMQRLEELKVQNTRILPVVNGTAEDQTYVYSWNVSDYRWAGPSPRNSGLRQLDLTVGWPVGGACRAVTPQSCKNKSTVTTFFRPLRF
jgi:prepilin-type N-terminal cleavage/methylation domain-containing protein